MSQNDTILIELAFNQRISYSQRLKVKQFWTFLKTMDQLKPYVVQPSKKPLENKDTDEAGSKFCRRMWYDQLKVFHEHGLDEAALAATESCKLCEIKTNDKCSDFADTVQQPYEELLNDIKIFDEKSNDKTNSETELEGKIFSIS